VGGYADQDSRLTDGLVAVDCGVGLRRSSSLGFRRRSSSGRAQTYFEIRRREDSPPRAETLVMIFARSKEVTTGSSQIT
jgi:hypothetical protein